MPQSSQKSKAITHRLMKFGVTGVGSTVIHIVVAMMFISILQTSTQLGNGVAFITATAFSYTVNTLWSFSNKINRRTAWRFIATSIVGLGLTMVISTIADNLGLHYIIGIGLVVICVPIYSFVAHSLWTYR